MNALKNAFWIGAKKNEDSPFKNIKWTKEKEEQLKTIINVEKNSRLFRKSFSVFSNVKNAKLYISGLGFYEAFINGKKIDEKRVLTPVVSDYFVLTRYDVYDVKDYLIKGENVLSAEVGPGWFSGTKEFWGWQQFWYGNLRMIAKLEIETTDGTFTICTDDSWKTKEGIITDSCVYNGEKWDFNLYIDGWNEPSFDDEKWRFAEIVNAPTNNLVESIIPPERIIRELNPVKSWDITELKKGYDFGENGSGIPEVIVSGKKGDVIRLEHAEYINEDGTLDKKTINRAQSVDEYILRDNKPTRCTLKFSWHGYQYMTIETSSKDVQILSVKKLDVHTAVNTIGEFKSGSSGFNKLHEGYVRTELACLQGVPIDCPQRDERKAWLGDAHVTAEMCLYNFDMKNFYSSFLDDLNIGRPKDTKAVNFLCPCYNYEATVVNNERTSIDWNMAFPIILIEHYKRYGDKTILLKHFKALKEHASYYISKLKDGFIPNCWFGDWLSFDYPPNTVNRVVFASGPDYHRQNPPYAATMFLITTLRILLEISSIIGETEDSKYYIKIINKCKNAIQKRYYDSNTYMLGGGGQFLQSYALHEHIVPQKDRKRVFNKLIESLEETKYHLLCGIIGTRVLFDVLNDFNRRDLIYMILSREGYLCPQHFLEGGRTTLTESPDWDGSGCHCMWASPDASLYKVFGGITIDRTKDVSIEIKPYFKKEVGFVECKQIIDEGEIVVEWKYENGKYYFSLSIPCNAKIVLPHRKTRVLNSGKYNFILDNIED